MVRANVLRIAYRLFRSNSRVDTWVAVGIVAVVLAPLLMSRLQEGRNGGR